MKKCILFLSFVFLLSCAQKQAVKQEVPLLPPQSQSLSEIPAQITKESLLSPKELIEPLYGKLLLVEELTRIIRI